MPARAVTCAATAKAVHVWHHGIQEHEPKRRARLGGAAQGGERRLAPIHDRRLHAQLGQQLCEDATVRRMVVHHQHGQPFQVPGHGRRQRGGLIVARRGAR